MNKAMTVVYEVGNGLYVNLTNRCSCACTFCVRQSADGVGGGDNLWLEHEPTFEEVMAAFEAFDVERYREVVFCGFGEPTEAFDLLVRVARAVKARYDKPVRLNTNGQGSLINGRDIAPELEGVVDNVSISLNTPDAERYQEIVRSRYGRDAFEAMLSFAREAARYVPQVTMTTVSTTLSAEEEERCQAICDELGVRYRIREWVG